MRTLKNLPETMSLLNRGRFVERVNEHISKALEAIQAMPDETGVAEVTVKFKLVGKGGELQLTPSVISKLPSEKSMAPTTFWIVDGELSVQHPSQTDLFEGPRDASRRAATGTADD